MAFLNKWTGRASHGPQYCPCNQPGTTGSLQCCHFPVKSDTRRSYAGGMVCKDSRTFLHTPKRHRVCTERHWHHRNRAPEQRRSPSSCFRQGTWADLRDRFLFIRFLISGNTVLEHTPQMSSHGKLGNLTQCFCSFVEGVGTSHLGLKNWNRFSFKMSCSFIKV